jgi:uncharacterized protein (TIGR03437 family)
MRFTQFLLRGALCLATFAGAMHAQPIAVLSGAQGSSTSIPVFTANPFGPQSTASNVPAGAFQLLAKPDGSKYYLFSVSPGITLLDRNFANPRQILTSLNASPTKAMLSPDGKRLFVIAGNLAYLIETATDTIVSGAINVTGTPNDVAFSVDSQTAFILSNGAFTAYVTPVDLTTSLPGQNLNLPVNGTATGITTSPNGLLYVSAPGGLFEINPRTLLVTPGTSAGSAFTIPVNATPGKVQFTSDGQNAIALNRTPATGAAIIFYVASKTATLATAANVIGGLDQLLVASDTRIFVHSTQNLLYELSLGGGFIQSPVGAALPTASLIQSIVPSNEVQAKSLFVIATANGGYTIYKVDLATNSIAGQSPLPNQGGQVAAFAGTNPTSGGVTVQAVAASQTISGGAVSFPLVARVLDANGVPVYNAAVSYSVLSGGVTLNSTTASTNSNGFAQVYATAGANPGTYTVQATTASAPGSGAPFTIVVSGGSTGTGGCTTNCNASGLFIVSGNGQIVSEQQLGQQLLLVAVRDALGNPLPNQQVTFSITQGQGTVACTGIGDQFPTIPTGACTSNANSSTGLISSITVLTDLTGQAGVKYLASSTSGHSSVQTIVNATSSVGSVNFSVTTVIATRVNNGGQASLPVPYVLAPVPGNVPGYTGIGIVTGSAGQTIKAGIQVQIVAADGLELGVPIAGVALNVSGAGDPKTTPSATCAGGAPISDANGIATCDVVLGPVVGVAALKVDVGGAIQTPLIEVLVTQGLPAKINITQGNNQQGNAGQQITLRAQVTDSSGTITPNVPVTWAVSQGTATISGASQQSDAQGYVQSTVTLGNSSGNVMVRLSVGSGSNAASATFTLTVNSPINVGAVTAVSGTSQTAVTGQPFGAPLVVRVTDTNGQPIPGVTVTFSVTAGAATLGAPAPKTDSQGNASTTVTAGAVGSIVIQASAGTQSAQFNLTSRLVGPGIDANSFRNAASNAQGLTPCGIAIVSGAGLAPGVQGTVSGNTFFGLLPLALSGVSVTVNGSGAPLFWVSNTPQGGEAVAFQTPCEVTPGPASVVVTVNGGSTTVSNVTVTKYQPGIFETVVSGKKYAVLLHASDGSYVTLDNPARRGEQLKMFVTGLGMGATSVGTDRAGTGGQASDAAIIVGVNNAGVRLIGSEYLPGAIGIYTITFEVPSDTAAGPYQNLGLIVVDPNDATNTPIYAPGSFLPIS